MGELVIYSFVWNYIIWLILEIGNKKAFTIFTGDITSHDNDNQMSRAFIEYVQSAVYSLFKAYLAGPVYAVLVCLVSFFNCSYISQSMYCIRVTMTHGPKLSMHLTASNLRLFQTSLNGTMITWQSRTCLPISQFDS